MKQLFSLEHCSDWVINVCASGNRNNAITTIISPANQDLCVEAEINNLNVCNNSPSFSEYQLHAYALVKHIAITTGL